MKISIIVLVLLILGSHCCVAKGDKNEDKNRKAIEREEQQFQRNLRKHPNDASTYLDHANSLAAINSEAARAGKFYQAALKIDSSDAAAYKEYGRYLAERLHAYDVARIMLARSLKLAPDDQEAARDLVSVDKILAMQNEENKLRDFGTTELRELNPTINYASSTKFDSIKAIVSDPVSSYNYEKLLARFLAGDNDITPLEMYMLIVGYAKQKTYNPFNYNDIYGLKALAVYSVDSAISRGNELVMTNPLNPSLNREMMYYYRKKGDTAMAIKYLDRIKQYFSGVLYSGNGTCEKPYVALWAKEEYNFIAYLGYKATDTHSMGMCAGQMSEIIEVQEPATPKVESIHFNVALIYMQAVGK